MFDASQGFHEEAESVAQLEQQLSKAKAENRSLIDAKQNLEAELKAEKDSSAQIQRQLYETKAEHSSLLDTHQQLREEFSRERESLLQLKRQLSAAKAEYGPLLDVYQSLQEEFRQEFESSAQLNQQLCDAKAEVASLRSALEESVAFGIEPWKVPRNTIQVERIIGNGGWGIVNEGKLKVAVKQFYPNILSPKNLSRLEREMRMLALVRHPKPTPVYCSSVR